MLAYEQLLHIKFPVEFVVIYTDGTTETLLRGDGICLTPPGDDPHGIGYFSAEIPRNIHKIKKNAHVR